MGWWNCSRAVYGAELRAGALGLVDHGWPVVPGTWWQGGGWRGLVDDRSVDSVPAVEGGVAAASCDPARIASWWSQSPYSVLVATGSTLDVLEVPAWVGRRAAGVLRSVGVLAPLAATPEDRWWFPLRPGGVLEPELAEAQIVLRGAGAWVMAPPSEREAGLVHWRVNPAACGWRLPDPDLVQSAVSEALRRQVDSHDARTVTQRPAGVVPGVRP